MPRRSLSVLATLLLIQALLCWWPDALRAADVTISSTVPAPQVGEGGLFPVTTTGTISGPGNGIEAGNTNETRITGLEVLGRVDVTGYALNVADGATLTTTTNAGTMSGDRVIQTYSNTTIGSITNSGTMSAAGYGVLLYGTSGTFSNLTGGSVTATNNDAIYLIGPTDLVSNAGTVTAGGDGVFVFNVLDEATNSGGIQGGRYGVFVNPNARIDLLTNTSTGTINGNANGVQNSGTVITATNAGLISGIRGLQADPGSSFTTLTNSGTVRGSEYGTVLYATTGTLENLTGGLIEATGSTDGIFHQGTTTTLTNDGRIAGVRYGILNNAGGTITTLSNAGTIEGSRGLRAEGGSTIGTLTNSGTVQGTAYGMLLAGTSGTISNLAGGRIAGTNDDGIQVSGAVTSLSNAGMLAGGTGSGDSGVELVSTGSIGTLTNTGIIGGADRFHGLFTRNSSTIGSIVNSGTIEGYSGIRHNRSPLMGTITNRSGGVIRGIDDIAISTDRGMTSITNEAGGLIESTGGHAIDLRSEVPTITNAGAIRTTYSFANGVRNTYAMANLTNSGTIQGGSSGHGLYLDEFTGTVTNTATGLIAGGRIGYAIGDDTNAIVNAGRINGGTKGMEGYYGISSLVNQAGGVISGTATAGLTLEDDYGTITNEAGGTIESAQGAGILVEGNYTRNLVSNAGLITGGTAGVRVNGVMPKLTNTGTIRYTGTGTGPAILVGSGGVLGDATGAGGAALVSTGGVALLDGEIVNRGTIHHGFTIENQNVTVSAAGGAGTFTSGTLDVGDGNLTFTGGTTTLGADVAVDGGTGTVFNEAVLAFTGARNFDGAFSQSSTGTLSSLIPGESAYGSIVIDGAAAFAGTLDLDLVGGFDFAEGQTYTLFTFASRTGGFTGLSVDGTALSFAGTGQWTYGSLILEEQWTGSSMSIAAVPEPSTLVLGAAGIACAVWMRHRRRDSRKA